MSLIGMSKPYKSKGHWVLPKAKNSAMIVWSMLLSFYFQCIVSYFLSAYKNSLAQPTPKQNEGFAYL
jgi:hypothetical protein